MNAINRRDFIGAATLLGVTQLGACAGLSSRGASTERSHLIRGAYVMTMDPELGDLEDTDVYVRDGEILTVGRGLTVPGAEVIDGSGMIVLPGFIETHWHTWTSLLRSLAGQDPARGYFPTSRGIGQFYTAEDMYVATRLAAAEAIHSGITFLHDWCHNVRGPEYANADLRALADAGIRGRFSYGIATAQPNEEPIDATDLARVRNEWESLSNDGLLDLGLAWRATVATNTGRAVPEVFRRDYAAARELGLPISVHASSSKAGIGDIAALDEAQLLGPHLQIIHAIWASPEEVAMLAASGTTISLSPYTELRIGYGLPITVELLDAGVPVGLSVDTTALSGNADMFAIMKVIQNVANARANAEFALPARRVLELATIEGARSMGVDDRVGSLTPGKRSDLIMIDTRDVNLAVPTDPAHLIVEAAQPANVDTVMIDGRVLKRGGQLTGLDVEEVVAAAAEASIAVRARANWS
ncbi:MAG TPA: amidohydrolase family protein [Gammaproteobacteria bacterium]